MRLPPQTSLFKRRTTIQGIGFLASSPPTIRVVSLVAFFPMGFTMGSTISFAAHLFSWS